MLSNNLIKRDTTGAFALIDSLVRHQVKHIFGYPGVLYYQFMMNYMLGNKKDSLNIY